jgi:hypothetical protein
MVLKKLALHQILKKCFLYSSYILLLFCFAIFAFYIFNNPQKRYKIVTDYKEGKKNIKSEKVMINPTIDFKYDDSQIFTIEAKKASHTDRSSITMYDVNAKGDIGTITAGKVEVNQKGDRLIFSKNPVLIIKNKKK